MEPLVDFVIVVYEKLISGVYSLYVCIIKSLFKSEMDDIDRIVYDPDDYKTPQIKVVIELISQAEHLKPKRVLIYNDDANFKYHHWDLRDVDIPCVTELMILIKTLFFIARTFIATKLTENHSEADRQANKLRALSRKLEAVKIAPETPTIEPGLVRHYYIQYRFQPFITHAHSLRTFINEVRLIISNILQLCIDDEDVVIRLCTVVDFINSYDSYMKTLIRHYEDFQIATRMLRDAYKYYQIRMHEPLYVIENDEIVNLERTLPFLADALYVPFNNNDVLVFAS